MELLGGINSVLGTWSVVVLSLVVPLLDRVLDAESTVLTVAVVVTIAPGTGAGVGSSLVGVLVGLHDIELWAVSSTNTLGIAVVESVSGFWVSIDIDGWGSDEVESSDTSAGDLGKIDVVLNGSTEEVWLVESIWIVGWAICEV